VTTLERVKFVMKAGEVVKNLLCGRSEAESQNARTQIEAVKATSRQVRPEAMDAFEQSVVRNRALLQRLAKWGKTPRP